MPAPKDDTAGIRQVIRALKANGWEIDSAWDGEESLENPNETDAIDWVMACDQGHIYFKQMSEKYPDRVNETGWVFFVLGNDPDEVVCDYTTNLDPTVEDLTRSWW